MSASRRRPASDEPKEIASAEEPIPEPVIVPHPTHGFVGGKGPLRPWQPVRLGPVVVEAPKEEGAGGVANLSESAQTEIRQAHEAERKDSE